MEQLPHPYHRRHDQARLRAWLTVCYALIIVYASLSPFSGWRNHGIDFGEVLLMPVSFKYNVFDFIANLLSYLPFGFLAATTLRSRFGAAGSSILAVATGAALSAALEYLQMYLPARISTNMDLLANTTGMLAGALLATGIMARPWLFVRLTRWRDESFRQGREADFGIALLALWIFAQTNPSLPMLGNVFIGAAPRLPFAPVQHIPFDWWQSGAVMLNLLMLGTLLLTLLRTPRSLSAALLVILSGVALAKFAAASLLLQSWALLLWINGEVVLGMATGMLLLFVAPQLPGRFTAALGGIAALTYFAIVNFLLDANAPSSVTKLYQWYYGHLLTYNGLAQTIAMIFPLLLVFHLWRARKV